MTSPKRNNRGTSHQIAFNNATPKKAKCCNNATPKVQNAFNNATPKVQNAFNNATPKSDLFSTDRCELLSHVSLLWTTSFVELSHFISLMLYSRSYKRGSAL